MIHDNDATCCTPDGRTLVAALRTDGQLPVSPPGVAFWRSLRTPDGGPVPCKGAAGTISTQGAAGTLSTLGCQVAGR